MTAQNAHRVANALLLTAGGALAVLAWRQPSIRRAAIRAVPLMLGGAPPLQVAAFVVGRAFAERHWHTRSEQRQLPDASARASAPEPPIPGVPV